MMHPSLLVVADVVIVLRNGSFLPTESYEENDDEYEEEQERNHPKNAVDTETHWKSSEIELRLV